jgi:hypothetical protein
MHVDQLPPIRVEQGILISREKKKYKQTMKDMAGQTLIVLKIDEKNNEISCYEKRMYSRKKKKGRP